MKNVIKLLQLTDSAAISLDKKTSKGTSDIGRKPILQRCATLLKALFDLEKHIDRVPLSSASQGVKMTGGTKCAVLPGQWLVTLLEKIGFTSFTVSW